MAQCMQGGGKVSKFFAKNRLNTYFTVEFLSRISFPSITLMPFSPCLWEILMKWNTFRKKPVTVSV